MGDRIFNFILRPLEDIEPWGDPPDYSLSWFGLTDGHYWLRLGGHNLYEYSPEVCRHWRMGDRGLPFVDYQVARLHEDLLKALPYVLDPVPADIAACADRLEDALEAGKINNSDEDYWAVRWLGCRALCGAHLPAGIEVCFVRTGDSIRVLWNASNLYIDGIPAWTAGRGDFSLTVDDFLWEVHDFHDRLMSQMATRVLLAPEVMTRRGIRVNVAGLDQEQQTRSSIPAGASQEAGFPGWDRIRPWIDRVLQR